MTPQHFNRVLAMYQILPGPEAHELCVSAVVAAAALAGYAMAVLSW